VHSQIFRFREKEFRTQVDHGGQGKVLAKRAARQADGLNCHFIDCVVVPPGSSIGIHSHAFDNEEVYVILKGTGVMTIEGVDHEVQRGDIIVNKPGGTHGLRNSGDEEIELIVIEYAAINKLEAGREH
jgi:mannose-6-phosphate isomerase-like protein (cupin superfamily)